MLATSSPYVWEGDPIRHTTHPRFEGRETFGGRGAANRKPWQRGRPHALTKRFQRGNAAWTPRLVTAEARKAWGRNKIYTLGSQPEYHTGQQRQREKKGARIQKSKPPSE
ncbi:hypothetical protein V5799_021415 [Amblyomma americanum]|uniref:Uncharacterized protein n=1 Tax=Amblyomma americanum TaxID=6943 RepID=A0AAQ4FPV8_AMBAM